MKDALPATVLDFWFGKRPYDDDYIIERFALWFDPSTNAEFDEALSARFNHTVEQARSGKLDHWAETASGALALILLLDQIPRNIYRGTAAAFSSDAKALATSRYGIKNGFDQQLDIAERILFCIPFEHAEDLATQQAYIDYCSELNQIAPPALKNLTEECIAAGKEHRDVVQRFGRFPSRNQALGRITTAEELKWLNTHHGWGQTRNRAGRDTDHDT